MSELRRQLMEGQVDSDRIGVVSAAETRFPPYVVVDRAGAEVEPITQYLRDLALSYVSPLTCRSYGYDLLRWFHLLWMLDVEWDRATGSEVDILVGWLKSAPNPQRQRLRRSGSVPGTVNARTGKPVLGEGYSPRTINHALSVVHGFYAFHTHCGRGQSSIRCPRRGLVVRRSLTAARSRSRRRSGVPDCGNGSFRPRRVRFRTLCGTSWLRR